MAITYAGSMTPPTDPGTKAVVATVTNPNYTGSAVGTLTINNVKPVVTITGPASGSLSKVNAPVTFTGTFTDVAIKGRTPRSSSSTICLR